MFYIIEISLEKVLLYNVKEDPKELENLAENPKHKQTINKLFATLLKLQKETGDTLDLKTVYANL